MKIKCRFEKFNFKLKATTDNFVSGISGELKLNKNAKMICNASTSELIDENPIVLKIQDNNSTSSFFLKKSINYGDMLIVILLYLIFLSLGLFMIFKWLKEPRSFYKI